MQKERTQGSKLFDERYPQIVETIDAVARRKRLGPCEAQELQSLVMLKIVDDDFAVLRIFEGRSSWVSAWQTPPSAARL